ncbi:bile acid:sodium symporter [Cytobacillus pseudoceanisediminis]|uniref:Arsenic resistance protein n=2 Tax=Cytobacillus TaxID=2675230 RepID=A0ABX3CQE0_9BACI|nr:MULTISPECIES: bile acid:sodium symporter [Cytobacillus]MBY0156868.1 arsenic resistance protein [Cytobacillus firmus]MBU8732887.1 bile acid:sodium symporter [Cytobacillus oceanisediminis]MCM3391244.1 bile acid:sodium symporter [Cytobacillus oceanisediminis]MCM3531385.1 bile acid:sodium symporter [Cytobacillus oceanisediminis]MCS0825789.1 bile acid:sodium symporter [Cytobacillus firmus]
MNLIEKLYTVIIFLAVIFGISIGQAELIRANAESFIVPLLVAMLYITFLQIPIEDIKIAFKNIKFTYTSILINFVWTPILAWLLAMVFLGDNPSLYIGFIMLMVTPCTDWYLIFTGIAKGNVALSTAILPLNLILQVILLPICLLIFGGTTGVIELGFLVESILVALIIPLVLAVLTKILLKNKDQLRESLVSSLSVLPIIFLSFAIVAMFASQGQLLLNHLDLLWKITIPILLFFMINLFVSQKAGQLMRFPNSDRASLSLTTLARNSPIALAIAMTAFPDQPLIALTLVVGPLLELPILAVITQILLFITKEKRT